MPGRHHEGHQHEAEAADVAEGLDEALGQRLDALARQIERQRRGQEDRHVPRHLHAA